MGALNLYSRRAHAFDSDSVAVLMAQRGGTADEAFQVLVELSQRSNRKLRDVAQAVVEQTRSASV